MGKKLGHTRFQGSLNYVLLLSKIHSHSHGPNVCLGCFGHLLLTTPQVSNREAKNEIKKIIVRLSSSLKLLMSSLFHGISGYNHVWNIVPLSIIYS